jgi:hypothetical protein
MFLDPVTACADPMWHGLKVGDWATWIAGGATFLAVCAAIGVPLAQGILQRCERKAHGWQTAHILAIEMNVLLGGLLSQILDRRQLIQSALSGTFNGNPELFAVNAKLWGRDDLPCGGDLQGLPYPVAPSIAALRANLTMYDGLIGRAVDPVHIKALDVSIRELKITHMLDVVQAALARAAGHLGKYEQSYALVNYLDNGNGGDIAPLPDYD